MGAVSCKARLDPHVRTGPEGHSKHSRPLGAQPAEEIEQLIQDASLALDSLDSRVLELSVRFAAAPEDPKASEQQLQRGDLNLRWSSGLS